MTIEQALQVAAEHRHAGRRQDAERLLCEVLQVVPRQPEAMNLLGMLLLDAGVPERAEEWLRAAIAVKPFMAQFHNDLGTALRALRRPAEAVVAYRRALEIRPDLAMIHSNLGVALQDAGDEEEAIAAYQRAIALQPDFAMAHNNLGYVLQATRRWDEAVAAYRRAVELQPDFALAWINLGETLRALGRTDEAIATLERAVAMQPGLVAAENNLAGALCDAGRFGEAIARLERIVELHPTLAEAHGNLAIALKEQGRVDEAIAHYREALRLRPESASLFSNYLIALHYSAAVSPAQLFEAHGEFDRRFAAPLRAADRPPRRLHAAHEPLTIGFISPHFAAHPVGHFFVRLLENLSREEFRVVCYSDTLRPDRMTDRLRVAAAVWRDTLHLRDEPLDRLIREDRIDILFDLAGQTAGHRLLVFARKPAPVQVTWLDYVGTTGLSAMDYLIADPREIPPGAERWHREKVLRLPDDYICYDPPVDAPAVGPLPVLSRGHVTFGSFNILPKTSPEIVRVWADILHRVPTARLLLKNRGLDDPATSGRYRRLFAQHGIGEERVEFSGWSPASELLARYGEVDLALDTFPYNGGLTTCEALWMGVPAVTCPGETFASRHGLTHLSAVGLPELIARDLDHYVELAVALVGDVERLAVLRVELRDRVTASALCDGPRFAKNFSALLRAM